MTMLQLGNITAIHGDCMDYMATLPDNAFDLAVVDPPFGLPSDAVNGRGKLKNRSLNTMDMAWDVAPGEDYFNELFRVSENQIIWGGNYFPLPPCRGFVIWDKEQPWENFSACEFAWTSFETPARMFRLATMKTGETKIHPTQKPVALYKWLLSKYVKPGFRILDTHGGSFSHAIACHDAGLKLTIIEKDKTYFDAAVSRLQWHQRQLKIEF